MIHRRRGFLICKIGQLMHSDGLRFQFYSLFKATIGLIFAAFWAGMRPASMLSRVPKNRVPKRSIGVIWKTVSGWKVVRAS